MFGWDTTDSQCMIVCLGLLLLTSQEVTVLSLHNRRYLR